MIEFISLCVCSACISCLCCLITSGLCILPATVRLRNKIVDKHLPDKMQWLGNLPPSEVWESDSCSNDSDCCPYPRKRRKNSRSSNAKKSQEVSRRHSKECTCVAESRDPIREKKKRTSSSNKSGDKSRPKRWAFCCKLVKSTVDSSESVKDADNEKPSETIEPKSSARDKNRKKSQIRKNGSDTYCAYIKSCSCTNVKEPADKKRDRKKYRRSETYSAKYPSESNRDKKRSKVSRKSTKCPKNCQCKIIAEEKPLASQSEEREREMKNCCKCGEKNLSKTRRRSK